MYLLIIDNEIELKAKQQFDSWSSLKTQDILNSYCRCSELLNKRMAPFASRFVVLVKCSTLDK